VSSPSSLQIGTGIADITGPAAERGMMGYASPFQQTGGIHMRLRARAFVLEEADSAKRLGFVSADLCMIGEAIKQAVVDRLAARLPGRFSHANLILSATHTHAGPGGYIHHSLYNFSTFGFDRANFDAIVHGIVEALVQADGNRRPGVVKIAAGEVNGLTKNRSARAYALNPEEERARYTTDTDNSMTVLRFEATDSAELGMISWFAIHGTSLDNGNQLISGDNSGLASHLFEHARASAGGGAFVAAFAQSNEGDASPNIYGGRGDRGHDQFESMRMTAKRELEAAAALYESASQDSDTALDSRHAFVDMARITVEPAWTGRPAPVTTCTAAIGVSMLAGTEDGRGIGWEGISRTWLRRLWGRVAGQGFLFWLMHPWRLHVLRTWWRMIRAEKAEPCQGEKVRAIPTGSFDPPWTPDVLPLQVCRIGSLGIVAVPFECTTMAGRRIKETVLDRLRPAGVTRVVLAGLANAYAGYVTTREEYDHQDYEGASTHFGPWTLAAIQQETATLASALAEGRDMESSLRPRPPGRLIDLQPGVLWDAVPPGRSFGGAKQEPRASYRAGEQVSATFWSGHPKNNLFTGETFLAFQMLEGGEWHGVADDHHPDTRFRWKRWPFFGLPFATATIEWTIPADARPGTYRVQVFGAHKPLFRSPRLYTGTSREFQVTA
jgi:neutral ceramidase